MAENVEMDLLREACIEGVLRAKPMHSLSYKEIGERAGMSKSHMANLLAGKKGISTKKLNELKKILVELGCFVEPDADAIAATKFYRSTASGNALLNARRYASDMIHVIDSAISDGEKSERVLFLLDLMVRDVGPNLPQPKG